jgi:formyltetrahydrofolate-dependent phosphoribosylglycinamide formyltransferase
MAKIRLAVLLSGSGTTLQNMVDRITDGSLDASVELVIASRPGLKGIARAEAAKVPCCVIDRRTFADVEAFSNTLFKAIDAAKVDLICLAGWLCLVRVPDKYLGKIMNIHPALLPSFGGKGMFGHHVHEAVLAHGCKVSGCTVHFVENTYDTGPIIVQRTCPVLDDDSADMLAARVFEQEKLAYPEAIRLFAQGKLKIEGRRVRVG